MGHTHRCQLAFKKKKKKNQVKSPSPESRVSKTGSDRESGRDKLVSEHRYTITYGLWEYDTNTSWYQSLGLGVYGQVFD